MNCPNCQRTLYSRQHKKCGYCGTLLPEELLLPPETLAAMKAELKIIEARRAASKKRAEETGGGDIDVGGFVE